jgi:hypothetical protein
LCKMHVFCFILSFTKKPYIFFCSLPISGFYFQSVRQFIDSNGIKTIMESLFDIKMQIGTEFVAVIFSTNLKNV